MTVVASAWPAERGGEQPSGHLRRDSLWDRRVALLDGEAAALVALGPVGLRRNGPWVSRDERHDTGMRWPG